MTSDHERAVLDNVPTGVFVAGAFRDAGNGARFAVEDPATEQPLCEVADATPDDAVAALAAPAGGA